MFKKNENRRKKRTQKLSFTELKKRANIANPNPSSQQVVSRRWIRNENVVKFVRLRARGKCQLCGKNAPFIDKKNEPFLEVHHIDSLAKKGQDTVENAVALCPNCHRKMHILDLQRDKKYLRKQAKPRGI